MIVAVIAAIIGIFLVVKIINCYGFGDVIFSIFAGGSLGAALGLLILALINSSLAYWPAEWVKTEQIEPIKIVALKDNGCDYIYKSYINEDLSYVYLYEDEKGIAMDEISAKDAHIKYIKEGETPRIEGEYIRPKNDILYYLFLHSDPEYTIYLPENSIIEGIYEVDLE